MSVELVTGYQGVDSGGEPKRHVSSSEDGTRQAGTVGLGCYVLSTGSKLSASMEDANTLIVADGDVMMYGRHVSMPDPTSFTIPTGVQGQKVSNIAILRYEVGSSSVESVTPLVLTGEPSVGTPTDPEYNDGSILDGDSPVDFPLYRVVTDGINAGDPEPLFDVLMPMADIWDSISKMRRVFSGSKLVTINNASYGTVFTDSEYRSIVGRSFNQTADAVVCMNGDGDAANTPIKGTTYMPSQKTIIFSLDSARSGRMRVNYLIVAK